MSAKHNSESIYAARRTRLIKQIKGEVACIWSSASGRKSRADEGVLKPNADLQYLTGVTEPDCVLILLGLSRGPRSILFLRDKDPHTEKWEGSRLGVKQAKRNIKVDEVRDIKELRSLIPVLFRGAKALHFAPGINPDLDRLITEYFTANSFQQSSPFALKDIRLLTSEMRVVKDRSEIQTLRHACDLTAAAFIEIASSLKNVASELHASRLLESSFARMGATGLAFPTIVASGKNATCLHHQPQLQPLWKKELVLIDAGASFRGYSADISRTFPVSGRFSAQQAALYEIVHSALIAGTKRAKAGSSLNEIHKAVVHEITVGLVEEKILKGQVSALIAGEKYKPFFMHSAGHFLGMDVHDVAPIVAAGEFSSPKERPLVPGNIFTLEPGIYIDAKERGVSKHYRGIGIRIEDDLLITESGCDVLTARVPSGRKEIEELCSR